MGQKHKEEAEALEIIRRMHHARAQLLSEVQRCQDEIAKLSRHRDKCAEKQRLIFDLLEGPEHALEDCDE